MTRFRLAHIHIGIHKTGTTAFQSAMAEIRAELASRCGILYPAISRNHSVPLFSLFCDRPETYKQNIRRGVFTPAAAARQNRSFARELEREFAGPESVLLISGEDLSSLKASGVERFRDWLEGFADAARIICYVRNPAEWASSYADQVIKGGATLADLRKRPPFMNLRARLTPWLEQFGRGSIEMHAYETARDHAHGVIGHIADRIGIPEDLYAPVSQTRLNERMSAEATILLSALNALRPKFVAGRIGPGRFPDDQRAFAELRGTRFVLDDDILTATLARSRRDIAWLKAEFGLELATAKPERDPAAPFSSEETLSALALLLLERMAAERSRPEGALSAVPAMLRKLRQPRG